MRYNNSDYTTELQEIVETSKILSKKNKSKYSRRLKSKPTKAETVFQEYLEEWGFKFRTQTIILGYIVDFYLPDLGLIIEVDGHYHTNNKEQDAKRDRILESSGFVVLRIANNQAMYKPDDIYKEIKRIGHLTGRSASP